MNALADDLLSLILPESSAELLRMQGKPDLVDPGF